MSHSGVILIFGEHQELQRFPSQEVLSDSTVTGKDTGKKKKNNIFQLISHMTVSTFPFLSDLDVLTVRSQSC